MSHQRFIGLQWKLAAIYLAASLLCSSVSVGAYLGSRAFGWEMRDAILLGVGVGVLTGIAVSLLGLRIVRILKMRLWEAGDMAGRIARGEFGARIEVGIPDEVGWLEEQLNRMADSLQEAVGELKRLAEQNRLLAEEAGQGAALAERARLARDLHDTVNQQLFVLAMRAAAARKRLGQLGEEASTLLPEMTAMEELARQAHSEARGLILQLRPTTLEQQGLGPALAEYLQASISREGWEIIDQVDQSIRLNNSAGADLFRVAQEALNNIHKHARASRVWVTLTRTEEGLLLQVRDDGQGFDMMGPIRPTAVGLMGMRERMAARGGALRVVSRPGEGTEVTVSLPLPEGGAGR